LNRKFLGFKIPCELGSFDIKLFWFEQRMKLFMIFIALMGIVTIAAVIVIAVVETRKMDKRRDK